MARTTVMIDDDLLLKLRRIQANRVRTSDRSISLSRVINELLRKGIKISS